MKPLMSKVFDIVPRWGPALILMIVIFAFSSRSRNELPDFGSWEYVVKKSAHTFEYGLLALAYLRALPHRNYKLAWFLTVFYALTDEFHQSFVPGRRASLIDVFLFDNLGAMIALFLHNRVFGANNEK